MKKLLKCLKCIKTKSKKLLQVENRSNTIGSINFENKLKNKKVSGNDNTIGKLIVHSSDMNDLISNKNIQIDKKDKNDNEKEKEIDKEIKKEKNKYTKYGLITINDINENEIILQKNSPLICEYEKKLVFSKKGLADVFDYIWKLDNYKKIWDKDNLIVELRNEGSPFNDQFFLIKFEFKQNKNELLDNSDISTLVDFFYNPKIRVMWDTSIKKLDKYEGNDNFYILNTCVNPPIFFMSERDVVEKKFIFQYENSTYIISSSIPNNIYPENKDVVRIHNYINYFKLTEKENYIIFDSLNQSDYKMSVPQALVNLSLPTTTKSWFDNIKKFAEKVIYNKEAQTIIEKH